MPTLVSLLLVERLGAVNGNTLVNKWSVFSLTCQGIGRSLYWCFGIQKQNKKALPSNRDTVVRACFYQKSTSLVSYPTQNDATDMFYPRGPPKPFLFKIKWFRYKWTKHLSNINDSSSFSVFCLRGSMCLHITIWAGKDSEWRQAHPPASEFVVTKRFHADSKIRTNRNFDRMQMLHNIWHTNRMLMGLWKNRDVGAYTLGRRCRGCFAGAFVCCMPLSNNNIVFEVFL